MLENHEVQIDSPNGNRPTAGSQNPGSATQVGSVESRTEAKAAAQGWGELEIKKLCSQFGAAFVVEVVEKWIATTPTCLTCMNWSDRYQCCLPRADAELAQMPPTYAQQCSLYTPTPF